VQRLNSVDKLVVKISGKIVDPSRPDLIRGYAEVLKTLHMSGTRIAVIVGGGPEARKYVEAAKALGLGDGVADLVGIEVSRINAMLLAGSIGDDVYTPIPRSIDDALKAWSTGRIVVMGGLQPGQSTSGTAAVIAELLGVKTILYASDVEGIYDKDPKQFSDARKLDVVSVDELVKIVRQRYEAGGYELLDPVAVGVIRRSCIEVVVFNGFNPDNLVKALRRQIGTVVKPC